MVRNRNLRLVGAIAVAASLLGFAPANAGNIESWRIGQAPGNPSPGQCRADAGCSADPKLTDRQSPSAGNDAARRKLDFENSLARQAGRAPRTTAAVSADLRQQKMLDFLNSTWSSAGRTVDPPRSDPSRLINALNRLWTRS